MNDPLVSVVINNYNKAPYIEECLQSVLDQTYTNWEIIFWDDNSTDGSWKIAEEFEVANKLSRKMFMHNTSDEFCQPYSLNVPLGVTRKASVEQCAGKYIAFLDSDDKWDKDKLFCQVKKMEAFRYTSAEIKLSFTDCYYWIEMQRTASTVQYTWHGDDTFFQDYPPLMKDPFINLLTKYNFIPMSTVMVERESLLEVMGESTHYTSAEDLDWWLKIAAKHKIDYINRPLTYYRVVPDSLTHGKKQRIRAQWYEIDAVREAMNYRKLSRGERFKVYLHMVRMYLELIFKEIMEKL